MGLKTKTIAIVISTMMISNAVSLQANTTAASIQQPSTICSSGFAGCVLPAKTKPAPVKTVAPAPVVEEVKKGGFPIVTTLVALGAVVGAIIIASGGDDEDDLPASP